MQITTPLPEVYAYLKKLPDVIAKGYFDFEESHTAALAITKGDLFLAAIIEIQLMQISSTLSPTVWAKKFAPRPVMGLILPRFIALAHKPFTITAEDLAFIYYVEEIPFPESLAAEMLAMVEPLKDRILALYLDTPEDAE